LTLIPKAGWLALCGGKIPWKPTAADVLLDTAAGKRAAAAPTVRPADNVGGSGNGGEESGGEDGELHFERLEVVIWIL
jgi:hypothetical protein